MKRIRVEVELVGNSLRLVPADPYSAELLDKLDRRKIYNVDVGEERKRGKLNLYWAGLALLHENLTPEQDKLWPTARKLHEAFMEELGYVTKRYRIDHSYKIEPDSIALDQMQEEEFSVVLERAKALAVAVWKWDPWAEWVRQAQERKDNREAAWARAQAARPPRVAGDGE